MAVSDTDPHAFSDSRSFLTWGMAWLVVACVAAGLFFIEGIEALLQAWQLPEYSHGPLIPVLSGLLFLRQLKEFPPQPGPKQDRWIGVTVIIASICFGTLGKLAGISDIVAYALMVFVAGLLLVSFGWNTGKHFWPPVLHLIYMQPLPDTLYYKMSTYLQFISSELGVWFLRLLAVPVFLDGNIIDLGVTKLHVAEACSGLRYLFPILSFSYIFAVLYKGPMWHKAVLLISAVPITILMNSIRIAIAGVIVNNFSADWLEGFSHFFEGWVIFLACILILFGLAWIMLRFQREPMGLVEALDLETDGLMTQAKRITLVQPSAAMITSALLMVGAVLGWQALPERDNQTIARDSFVVFPSQLDGGWRASLHAPLAEDIEAALGADDYHNVTLHHADGKQVGLFMAWYADQTQGGVHSPEICLPSAGWEIAWLERTDVTEQMNSPVEFNINRAIIQRGERRMMVYYWFEQKGRRVAWDMAAKMWLVVDGIRSGRTDGGMVRLTTEIHRNETDAQAEARLEEVMSSLQGSIPRFMPDA